MTWHLRDRTWQLLDDAGRVLDSLQHDRDTGYCDSRGVLISRRWDDARAAVERKFKTVAKGQG